MRGACKRAATRNCGKCTRNLWPRAAAPRESVFPFVYRPLVRESPRRPCGLRSHGLSQAGLYGDRPALVRYGIGNSAALSNSSLAPSESGFAAPLPKITARANRLRRGTAAWASVITFTHTGCLRLEQVEVVLELRGQHALAFEKAASEAVHVAAENLDRLQLHEVTLGPRWIQHQ
jgi:hypothetical protein